MVSTYRYITEAEAESYAATDYSVLDGSLTPTVIESNITQAERIVNVFCKQTFTTPAPDAVVSVTLELTKRLMHNLLIDKQRVGEGTPHKYKIVITSDMAALLQNYVALNDTPVKIHRFYKGGFTTYG